MTELSELFSIREDLREKALSAKTPAERMRFALLKHACESDIFDVADKLNNRMKSKEPLMTRCEKSIYVAATTLDRRIGQKCAWCSMLSDEESALAHAINAVKDSYKRYYPLQCAHLDEFEKNFKGADASIAAFNGEADLKGI